MTASTPRASKSAPWTASTSTSDRASDPFPNQLYIDPEECIDCQACEPACPWDAPLCDTEVPAVLEDDIALNASIVESKHMFRVPLHIDKAEPTTSDVAANKNKWGWTG